MLLTTVDSTACYLLTCEEVWGKSISGEFATRSASDAGLSGREHRRALAAETILSLNYQLFLEGAAAAQLRAALRAYNNQPILAPFWPADCLLSDLALCRWSGGLRLFYEPGMGSWQVLASTAPNSFTPTAACRVVPLLWSRFAKLPAPGSADGDEAMEVAIAVVENGPAAYAIRPTGVTVGTGPAVGALIPRLLSLVPDWDSGVTAGGIELRIDRTRIGYGRAENEAYVSQTPRRLQKFTLPPLGDEVAQLVALFREAGTVGSFWVPGAFAETRLAAAVTSGAVIQVADPTVLADLGYIALASGDTVAACKILSRAGSALTLQTAPGTFAAGTAVCSLLLARFTSAKLKITWETPTVASATVEVVELPTETTAPAGETVGTTIGALGAPCWLYSITDGDLTWLTTSYESELDAGALGVFTPRPISHGDRTSELNLERHDMELTAGWWEGSPFERIKLDRLAPKLTVQVYRGTVAAPASASLIFTGTVQGPRFEGAKCTCKLAGMTSLFDVKGPIAVTSTRCWAPLYSPPCGLIEAAHDSPAQLAAAGTGALFFQPVGGGGWPATVADHYRYGYAERTLLDGSKRRHRIVGSSPVITDGYTSPLRSGLVEWWDFPEESGVRYGQANGLALDETGGQAMPYSIPVDLRRRAPGVCRSAALAAACVTSAGAPAYPDTGQMSLAGWFRLGTGLANPTGFFMDWSFAKIGVAPGGVITGEYAMAAPHTISPPDPWAWVFVGLSVNVPTARCTLYVSGASASGTCGNFPFNYGGAGVFRLFGVGNSYPNYP
jgi:hypothetical protein